VPVGPCATLMRGRYFRAPACESGQIAPKSDRFWPMFTFVRSAICLAMANLDWTRVVESPSTCGELNRYADYCRSPADPRRECSVAAVLAICWSPKVRK
jgi:hypothetical protein